MLCRVCLKESQSSLQIFDVNGRQMGIADILQRHFWFQPQPNDPISTVVCRVCWMKINDFHQFYLTVEHAHLTFDRSLRPIDGAGQYKDESLYPEIMEKELMLCEVNIKEESLDNLYSEDDRIEEKEEEIINPLQETELIQLTQEDINVKSENLETVNVEEQEEAIVASQPKASNRIPSKRKSVQKKMPESSASFSDNEESKKVLPPKSKKTKSTKLSKQDEELVKKYIKMGCDLCAFVAEDFAGMTKHFRIQHANTKPYVTCCDTKLLERLRVVEHAYKHENPEYFKCHECKKVFSGSSTLQFHMLTTHAPAELLPYKCDQCPKKFPRQSLLDLHKPTHIPENERTFICDQCPTEKAFASSYLLNHHKSMRHRRATNVCHVCAKKIHDKHAFEKHVRLHFEDSGPRVKCPRPNCDSWLKDEENLRSHIRRHDEEGQTFTCTKCGNSYKNRRALISHTYSVHPKHVFTCEECKKTFKSAKALREHMTQHTGERLYDCQFCTQTFNSKANMYSHKKKRHPVEWEMWRKANTYTGPTN